MSLESGNFIKDLVSSNPDGADPKSQGDDHLRLIKNVLKQQFASFTQGIPLTCKEGELNQITGIGGSRTPRNIDTGASAIDFYGVVLGTTGTIPPGGNTGDWVLTFPWDGNRQMQLWLGTGGQRVWYRVYISPTWSAWTMLNSIGWSQVWTAPARSFNTDYTNNTGRPIMVVVSGSAANVGCQMQCYISGLMIAQAQLHETDGGAFGFANTITVIVPPGLTYAFNVSAAATLLAWRELT